MARWSGLAGRLIAVVLLTASLPATVSAQMSEERIDAAIEAGVAHVWSQQQPDGRWGQYDWAGGHHYAWGRDAIALLTLEFADVDIDDERYQKGLKLFLEAELEQNYEHCCRTMILAHLVRRTKGDKQAGFKKQLIENVRWIEEAQGEHGGWTYVNLKGGKGYHDFSNSQMAVLALSEAILSGVEVSPEVMKKAQDLFLSAQRPDGGWNYRLKEEREQSYGGMTAAAVATLFITRDYLTPQVGCPCRNGRAPRQTSAVDKAIAGGVKWLGANYVSDNNPGYSQQWWIEYWHYSVARVGVATGYRFLGEHNWYREGAAYACPRTAQGGQNFPYGCLATLFLIKGKAPLLYNKLTWDGPWDLHPRDLANLTRYISNLKEQAVGWQTVPVTAALEDWREAPVLYISAEEKIDFTDEQKEKLRRFTETGGTIFFEATCGSRTSRAWWETLCKELWPKYEFQRVADDHPLWTADVNVIAGRRPLLYGLSDGLRTFVFLAPSDLSCSWNTAGLARNAESFLVGNNLYMYASDKRPIRKHLARRPTVPEYLSAATVKSGAKAALKMAALKTGGDWYAGERYQPMAQYNARRAAGAPELAAAEAVEPVGLEAARLDVLWLTGRQSAALSDEAVKAVKAYLAAGGFLLAEATLGDERFGASFAETAAKLGLKTSLLKADAPLLSGNFAGGAAGYDLSKVRYSSHLKAKRIGQAGPLLEVLYLNEKLVGVYSPYDLMFSQTGCVAFGNLGYEADDARAVVTNILLEASVR